MLYHKKAFTLLEVLLSISVLSIISVAIYAVNYATFTLYLKATDQAMLGYELQYVSQHIMDRVMLSSVQIIERSDREITNLGKVMSFSHYDKFNTHQEKTCKYEIIPSTKEVVYDDDIDNDPPGYEVLNQNARLKVGGIFKTNGNIVRIDLDGASEELRGGARETLVFQVGVAPRIASFPN
ncbi:MAG: prepilin-type N-terminal cleavage/methylation domain-containing protein [Candidatus Omnitrophota bacterium]